MKKNILLVEDDSFLQQLYKDLLLQEGYAVTTAGDGEKAFDLLVLNNWDLVLLDVILPKLSGFEILKKLTEESKIKLKCPVILMTNLDSTESDRSQLEQADDYWIKSSMSPPDFISKVHSILKGSI